MHVVEEHGLWLLSCHALPGPLSLERHQGPSLGSVAQPLSAVAHRDILRSQDDADRLSRVLGISLAGAHQSLALSKVDRRDGPLRPPQTEKLRFQSFSVSRCQSRPKTSSDHLETLQP